MSCHVYIVKLRLKVLAEFLLITAACHPCHPIVQRPEMKAQPQKQRCRTTTVAGNISIVSSRSHIHVFYECTMQVKPRRPLSLFLIRVANMRRRGLNLFYDVFIVLFFHLRL